MRAAFFLLLLLLGCDAQNSSPDLSTFDLASSIPDLSTVKAVCDPLPVTGHVVDVTDTAGLVAAVNAAQPGDTIRLADGTYSLTGNYVYLTQHDVTLRGGNNRESVIIDGNYQTGSGQSLITIAASNVTVANLTVTRAYDHPIHVDASAGDITNTLIYNVHVKDPGQQGIKVNGSEPGFGHSADNGVIACSQIDLTDSGRSHIRDNCYTGGIDLHAGRGWQVRDNLIEGFWCASGLSEHGIHFWKGARDSVIERNLVRDCARGIGLGLANNTDGRTYSDDPCSGVAQVGHFGGMVRNNMISAANAGLFASAAGFDSGISLELACKSTVVHNSVASTTAPTSSSIEWRFAGTQVTVTNNLVTNLLKERDSAVGTKAGNLENAPMTTFVSASDLHLTGNPNNGVPTTVADDIDGDTRNPQTPDVGADEIP